MLRIIVLGLYLGANTAAIAEPQQQPQQEQHATPAGQTQTSSRPGTAPTGSQESYAQIAQFAEVGKDLEVSALVDGKFKLASEDLSTKFPKWISSIEQQHQKIWSDCKDKPAGKQLNELLKQYVDAIAQETSEATANKGTFLKDGKDASVINAQRFYAITAGVREILDAQLASAPADKKARAQAQNESLLSMMDKTNAFLAGIDPKGEASDQKLRETVLEKVKAWDLAKVSESGTKIEETATDALKEGAGVQTSIRDVVNGVQKGEGLCWFDQVQASSPNGLRELRPGETETTTTTTTEIEKVEEAKQDDPAPAASYEPQTTTSSYSYGTQSGYGYDTGKGYDPLSYDPLAYGALGGYDKNKKYGNLNYTPMTPYIPSGGNYKVAAPAPVPAAAAVPAPAPLPISAGGFGGGPAPMPFPPMGGPAPMPIMPPPPPPPPMAPVPLAEVEEKTETEAIRVGTPIPPVAMPTMPPPPPPTVVNTATVMVRIRYADGTVAEIPPTQPIPAGATVISSPNPNGGTPVTTQNAAPNANAITGQISNVNTAVR